MDKKKETYLKHVIYLYLQKKEIEQKMEEQTLMTHQFYLVNKDIIENYSENSQSSYINQYIEKYKEKNNIDKYSELLNNESYINDIIGRLNDENLNFEIKRLNPYVLLAEKLKISEIEYPYNFCLVNKFIFENLIGINQSIIIDFSLYDTYIFKEGIFIIIERNKEKVTLYYLDKIKQFKINKLFLFSSELIFQEELKTIHSKGLKKYFSKRNIVEKKAGFFNIILDGKIIGKYFNIVSGNYSLKKESGDIQVDFKSQFILQNTKDYLVSIILPHMFLCLSTINHFKKYLIARDKSDNEEKLILDNLLFLRY